MKKLLLGGFLLPAIFMRAQSVSNQVIASDGGFAQNAQGSVAWTTGEPVSETYATTANITTMGFHQPDVVSIPTLIKEQGADRQILIYPNPVSSEVFVDLGGLKSGRYNFQLVDALGKLIYTSDEHVNENSGRLSIKLSELAAGAYFLRVSGKDFNKTVKLDKINN